MLVVGITREVASREKEAVTEQAIGGPRFGGFIRASMNLELLVNTPSEVDT